MPDPINKPRGESDWFGVAIEDDLEDGESTVTTGGYPTVTILHYGTGGNPGSTDVTSQFVEDGQTDLQPSYATVTTDAGEEKQGVRFHLCSAKADDGQLRGKDYRIECQFATDGDREPVAGTKVGELPRLRVR